MRYNLPLSDIVDIQVNLSPRAVARRGFNLGLLIGQSEVIPLDERVRLYSSLRAMFEDGFRETDPEYIAAGFMFSQRPAPARVAIGRHNSIPQLAEFEASLTHISSDLFSVTWEHIPSDGNVIIYEYLTDIADISDIDIPAYRSVFVDGGSERAWDYAENGMEVRLQAGAIGIRLLELTPENRIVSVSVLDGQRGFISLGLPLAESVIDAVRLCRSANSEWYLFSYLGATPDEILSLARFAESATPVCVQFYTTDEPLVLRNDSDSIFAKLRALSFRRSLGQFSRTAYAAAGIMGWAMGANTRKSGSAYTLMHKRVVGIKPDNLSVTQADHLQRANGNYYVSRGYDDEYSMFERGTMGDGVWFDEILNLDMLVNDLQLAILDLLTSRPKIPHTEGGVSDIKIAMRPCLRTARMTGFIAPGRWNAASIYTEPEHAPLQTGDYLENGYLILSEPVDYQSPADRENRIAPPIYIAIKLAGAIHTVRVRIDVNR